MSLSAKIYLLGVLTLYTATAWAGSQAIVVGPSVHVSSDQPDTPLAETWMAVNPRDPRVMIASSMAFPPDGRWASAMYRSVDGGKTWRRSVHGPHADKFFWGADPVVIFSSDGTAYYSDLEWGSVGRAPFDDEPGSHEIHANVFMYRSDDGGQTWSDPIALYGNDHSSIAVDESGGKYRGRVYVSYTTGLHTVEGKPVQLLGFAYSDDGGRSYRQRVFAAPTVAPTDGISDCPSATDLLVTSDGTLVLTYTCEVERAKSYVQQTWALTSIDGGRTFDRPHLAASTAFSEIPHREPEMVDYWPRMAVDRSDGPRRDQLYLAYEDVADSHVRIMITSSRDAGRTWDNPVQVTDGRSKSDANTPAVAVSATGIVGVSWYDRRNDPRDECYEEYFSASLDGGATFLPNVALRGQATCPVNARNLQPNVTQSLQASDGTYSMTLASAGPRFVNGGETQGLVGLSRGRFHLAWIDGSSGVLQLVATDVSVSAHPLGTEVGELLDVRLGAPTLDPGAHSLTVRVNISNETRRAIRAPLVLVISRMDSALEGLRATNSENLLAGVGAQWRIRPASGDGSALRPGEAARPLVLEFKFDKVPADHWDGFPLSADFHIYEDRP